MERGQAVDRFFEATVNLELAFRVSEEAAILQKWSDHYPAWKNAVFAGLGEGERLEIRASARNLVQDWWPQLSPEARECAL